MKSEDSWALCVATLAGFSSGRLFPESLQSRPPDTGREAVDMMGGAAEADRSRGWLRFRVVLFFALGLAALDAVLASQRALWRAYDPDEYKIKVHECIAHRRDLIVAGGSPVGEGIDPAILAGTRWNGQALQDVFNLGLSGATTSTVWQAVHHGIGAPPHLLVYGITATDLNDGRDEFCGLRSLMDIGDVVEWVRQRPEAANFSVRQYIYGKCSRSWNLYHFRNAIRLCAADQIERVAPGTCSDAAEEGRIALRWSTALTHGNGFAPRADIHSRTLTQLKAAGTVPPFIFLDHFHLGGHLRYLHKLLDWGESHGVPVILLDMPVSADLARTYPAEFAAYCRVLADVEQTRQVRVLRPSREALLLNDDDFGDLIHLNAQGTAKLSEWLRQQLDG
jgi:hypothetical protein